MTHAEKAEQMEKDLKAQQLARVMYWSFFKENPQVAEDLEDSWAFWLECKATALENHGFKRDETIQMICATLKSPK